MPCYGSPSPRKERDVSTDPRTRGLASILGAYLIWGFSPAFWKLLGHVPSGQLLAHRMLWCALLLTLLLLGQGRFRDVGKALASPRVRTTLMITALCIASNWLVFLWAVMGGQILQASLGYYINPLVTVLLGMLFLGERLSRLQWISIGLAAAGVAILTFRLGTLPWMSLFLAGSFGLYGLLRKRVDAEAQVGLLVETLLLSPLALFFLLRLAHRGDGAFAPDRPGTALLLVASGVVTAAPLVLFAHGVRRLPLSVVGFLQYFAPTLQWLLAVFVYREPFGQTQLVAFLLIWAALLVFSRDMAGRWRQGVG